jgi:serine/threonine protein kinase
MVESKNYNQNIDLWCLGVLCYEFCVGKPPFESQTHQQTYSKIKLVELKFPEFLSKEVCDLIRKLLQKDPNKRLSTEDVMKHPWIQRYNKFN